MIFVATCARLSFGRLVIVSRTGAGVSAVSVPSVTKKSRYEGFRDSGALNCTAYAFPHEPGL